VLRVKFAGKVGRFASFAFVIFHYDLLSFATRMSAKHRECREKFGQSSNASEFSFPAQSISSASSVDILYSHHRVCFMKYVILECITHKLLQ